MIRPPVDYPIPNAPMMPVAKAQKMVLGAFWVGFRRGMAIAVIFGVLGFGAGMAWGHGWYSQACCSGKDCAPIAASAVTWTPNGWRVELRPGQHPMVTLSPMVELVPFDEVLPSQDDQWHACVRTDNPSPSAVTPAERIICLYIPEGQFGS